MRTSRWQKGITAIVAVALMAVAVPATAYAAVIARTSAQHGFTVLTWKAVAVASGGSATSGTYRLTFVKANNQTSRQGVFDVVNTGASSLSGVSVTTSSSSGVASNSSVTFTYCSKAWTATTNSGTTTYSCSGSSGSLGSSSNGGNGTITASRSIAVGGRLYVRASTTASANNTTVAQTISIKVTRSQAAAKRNR